MTASNALMLTSDKQQNVSTEEGCAAGSNISQITGNGDISQHQQHPPPLQVLNNYFTSFVRF